MAVLFMDSFSGYATADIPTRWVGANNTASLVNPIMPTNSQAGATVLSTLGGGSGYVVANNFGSKSRMIMGCRYYRANSSQIGYVMGFGNPNGMGRATPPCHIKRDGSGTYIYSGDSGGQTLLASGPVVPNQEWHH